MSMSRNEKTSRGACHLWRHFMLFPRLLVRGEGEGCVCVLSGVNDGAVGSSQCFCSCQVHPMQTKEALYDPACAGQMTHGHH